MKNVLTMSGFGIDAIMVITLAGDALSYVSHSGILFVIFNHVRLLSLPKQIPLS